MQQGDEFIMGKVKDQKFLDQSNLGISEGNLYFYDLLSGFC